MDVHSVVEGRLFLLTVIATGVSRTPESHLVHVRPGNWSPDTSKESKIVTRRGKSICNSEILGAMFALSLFCCFDWF